MISSYIQLDCRPIGCPRALVKRASYARAINGLKGCVPTDAVCSKLSSRPEIVDFNTTVKRTLYIDEVTLPECCAKRCSNDL